MERQPPTQSTLHTSLLGNTVSLSWAPNIRKLVSQAAHRSRDWRQLPEKDRQKDRQADRQTDRQTDRQAGRQAD